MTIATCPKCDDKVRLPANASPKATVSCPLCQAEFQLSEILDAMPPPLIVVDDPDAPTAASQGAAGGPLEADELVLSPPEPVTGVPDFGIQSSVTPAATTTAAPRKRRTGPRPKRKKSTPVEIAKVVLGGIAGLTIAQLILWWMPWTKYRRDPFQIGPKISQFAPWAVPEKFHAKKTSSENEGELPEVGNQPLAGSGESHELSESGLPVVTFDGSDNAEPTGESRPQPKSASDGSEQTLDASNQRDSSAGAFEPEPPKDPGDPLTLNKPDPKTPNIADDVLGDLNVDLDPLAMLEPITDAKSKTETPEPTAPPDTEESSTVRLPNARKMTAEDVDRAVLETEPAIQAWNDAANAASYLAFAKLGEAVALAEEVSPQAKAAVQSLLEALGSESGKLEILAKAGKRLLENPDAREGSGVLLVGVVKGIDQKGDLYETQVEITSGDAPVLLYDDTNPGEVYQVDSKILVLGAIIENPTANLNGYDGSAKSVVWGGAARAVTEE
jgi:hypothetical protein